MSTVAVHRWDIFPLNLPHRLKDTSGFRFALANVAALTFVGIGIYIALPWIADLAGLITLPGAIVVIMFIAFIPGYLNAFLLASLLLFRQPKLDLNQTLPPISVLIAGYNEADNITETFRGLASQNYPNKIEVIFVNDGSTDSTLQRLRQLRYPGLKIITVPHQGKAAALNAGLDAVSNDITVTIDADTFLYKDALRRIVARLQQTPNCAAVAGWVLAKNSRETRLTRMQEWDYFLAIGAVKRVQSGYRSTLVAQGAFSAYCTEDIIRVRKWPSCIGEDIVLTWALIDSGRQVTHEPTAIGFTKVPTNLRDFYRQRRRWASGMIEGLKNYVNIIWHRRGLASFFVGVDLLFPPLDFFYAFAFLPGVVLALFGYFYIAGLMTLLILPLNALIIMVMLHYQRDVFQMLGLKIRNNIKGLLVYFFFYQAIMSPICLVGYCRELLPFEKQW